MGRKGDYVPHTFAGFNDWFGNLTRYVKPRCMGDRPLWPHIQKERLEELLRVHAEWENAYAATLLPHARAETRAKNLARKAALSVIRPFVQQFLMYPPVTDMDRINMGLHNRAKRGSPIPRPRTRPAFTLKPKDNRVIQIDFWDEGSAGKARPYGCNGAVVCFAILDHPPASYEELVKGELATSTPYLLEFNEADRGKRVYVALFWQNNKGDAGPWSDIQSTIVP